MALSDSAGIGSALPSQVGVTSGYVLQTDGAAASWVSASASSLPSQGGNSGKYLTTNGTSASWAAVTADGVLPSQTGNNGKVLTTNGTTASWGTVTGAGVDTMAAVGAAPNANGATIASTTLTLEPADGTNPGVVTAAAQTFGGAKTFAGGIVMGTQSIGMGAGSLTGSGATITSTCNIYCQGAGFLCSSGAPASGTGYGVQGTASWTGNANVANGASAKAFIFDNGVTLSDAGARLLTVRNNTAEVMSVGTVTLDLTGLGAAGSIKLKSPDGTTYTATIANGGTWSIA